MQHPWLAWAGMVNALAALAHVGCIVYGARWYRFFGAGERMAQLADAGHKLPARITAAVAAVLLVWSWYALAAAFGATVPPGQRWVLAGVALIYTARGLLGMALAIGRPGSRGAAFWYWSSLICLGAGALHALGLRQAWSELS